MFQDKINTVRIQNTLDIITNKPKSKNNCVFNKISLPEIILLRTGSQCIINLFQEMLSEKMTLIEIEQKINEINERINSANMHLLGI